MHLAQEIATLVLTGALALLVLGLLGLAVVALRMVVGAVQILSETADLVRSVRSAIEGLARPAAAAAGSLAHMTARVDEVSDAALDTARRLLYLESAAEDQVARMLFGLLSLFEGLQAVLARAVQGRAEAAADGAEDPTGEGEVADVR